MKDEAAGMVRPRVNITASSFQDRMYVCGVWRGVVLVVVVFLPVALVARSIYFV